MSRWLVTRCASARRKLEECTECTDRGGKVAIATALSPELPPSMLSNLTVVDIAPSRAASLSNEFTGYFEGMRKIEDAQVSTRQDAQTILMEYEKVSHFSQVQFSG